MSGQDDWRREALRTRFGIIFRSVNHAAPVAEQEQQRRMQVQLHEEAIDVRSGRRRRRRRSEDVRAMEERGRNQ